VGVDRNVSSLKRTSNIEPYELDVTDSKGLKKLYEDVSSKYGRVDIVCNNAGIFERTFPLPLLPAILQLSFIRCLAEIIALGGHFWANEDVETYPTIDINLTSLIKSTRHAISTFLSQPKPSDSSSPLGIIINTASVAGFIPVFGAPIYAASKWGVIGFTRSMDYLHPKLGIRVCAIAPGAFRTPIWDEKVHWMNEAGWVPLEEVVDAYMRCIEDESIKGGEVLEVLVGQSRIVELGGEVSSGDGVGPVDEEMVAAWDRVIKYLKGEKVDKF